MDEFTAHMKRSKKQLGNSKVTCMGYGLKNLRTTYKIPLNKRHPFIRDNFGNKKYSLSLIKSEMRYKVYVEEDRIEDEYGKGSRKKITYIPKCTG